MRSSSLRLKTTGKGSMMKSYYEGHEIIILSSEVERHGNTKIDRHPIRDFVMALERIGLADGTGRRCLVIGVGTGPMACNCLGFEVDGIDISETAIRCTQAGDGAD